jgi:hypothetical protein
MNEISKKGTPNELNIKIGKFLEMRAKGMGAIFAAVATILALRLLELLTQ